MEHAIHALTGVTAELVRENRALVLGLAADRGAFRDTLRELSGFVATAGIALERLERQVSRVADTVEAGLARLESAMGENNRLIRDNNGLILDNNRQIVENNRLVVENNRLIAENNTVIRRLLDVLARGLGDRDGRSGRG
jgi:Na+/phosphate symporter